MATKNPILEIAMNWEFIVVRHGREENRFPIRQGVGYIGRRESSEYVLAENYMSRQNIEVRAEGDRITLTEMCGRGRVSINGKRFCRESLEFGMGDILELFDFLIFLRPANLEDDCPQENARVEALAANEEFRAIFETILANPADDAPRLVISDWLEEHDYFEYAQFIRSQLSAPLISDDIRGMVKENLRYVIYQSMLKKWLQRFWINAWHWSFRRGFISEINLTCDEFMANAKEILSSFPVEEIFISNRNPTMITQSPDVHTFSWADSLIFNSNFQEYRSEPIPIIPMELICQMQAIGIPCRGYATPREAYDALSAACVAYGKSL